MPLLGKVWLTNFRKESVRFNRCELAVLSGDKYSVRPRVFFFVTFFSAHLYSFDGINSAVELYYSDLFVDEYDNAFDQFLK